MVKIVKKTGVFLGVLGIGAAFWVASTLGTQDEKTKKEKLNGPRATAEKIATEFMKALVNKEGIEAVMKDVDAPFLLNDEGVLTKRDQLKKRLETLLDRIPPQPVPPTVFKVSAVSSFGSFPTDALIEQDVRFLKKNLQATDFIVFLYSRQDIVAVPVRVKEGKVKILGLRTHLEPLCSLLVTEVNEKADKELAKRRLVAEATAKQFMKALNTKNLDQLVRLSDEPWATAGLRVIKGAEALKKELKWLMGRIEDASQPKEAFLTVTYGGMRPLLAPEDENLDQVVGSHDFAVYVRPAEMPGQMLRGMVFVRVREGKGKLIGVAD